MTGQTDRAGGLTTYVPGDEEEYGIYTEKRSRVQLWGAQWPLWAGPQQGTAKSPPAQPGWGSQGPPAPIAAPHCRESSMGAAFRF